MKNGAIVCLFCAVCAAMLSTLEISLAKGDQYAQNPFLISLDIPGPDDPSGGIIVASLAKRGVMDFLVTRPGYIAAYSHDGKKLWCKEADIRVNPKSEKFGLPGHHGPGIQAGYIESEEKADVLFIDRQGTIHMLDGLSGEEVWTASPPAPDGARAWELAIICTLRGIADHDILLQATNKKGYRLGRFLAAYRIEDLKKGIYEPMWKRDDFHGCAHNGAKVADINMDGRDEIVGGDIISPEGALLYSLPMKRLAKRPHIDSIFIQDVRPELPGLEVVALEEDGENRVFLYNTDGLIWQTHYKHQEPQNAAVGRFVTNEESAQIWCRSRYNEHQKPFVFDAEGNFLTTYEMDSVAPDGWTVQGVEVINTIYWTGCKRQFAVAKERHKSGDVAIFDPLTGEFLHYFKEKADRLFVADVSGDWREEIIVLSGNQLKVYFNEDGNEYPGNKRLWAETYYRRAKMNYNYYSP